MRIIASLVFMLLAQSLNCLAQVDASMVDTTVKRISQVDRRLDTTYRDAFRNLIKQNIAEAPNLRFKGKKMLPDTSTALAVAEIYLFKVYGKSHILLEKPYRIENIDNYWLVRGDIPKGIGGGIFYLILNAYDGAVIYCKHAQ